MRPLATLFLCCLAGCLADPRLAVLRSALAEQRAVKPEQMTAARGATPKLTTIKHDLRDWVDDHLSHVQSDVDERALAGKLNTELRASNLVCGWTDPDPSCPDQIQLGYLGRIELRRTGGLLAAITRVGIECGFDESVYLYKALPGDGWQRIWQNEQNSYIKDTYQPQTIVSVDADFDTTTKDFLVMTLGRNPWCQSNWHNVYFRVFRPGPGPEGRPVVDDKGWAFVAGNPINGVTTSKDALFEFITFRTNGDFRSAVRHYRIDHDVATLIDPVALSPMDFVEEWVALDWTKDARRFSESAQLMEWHRKLTHRSEDFRYDFPTYHCQATPDQWQLAYENAGKRTYFKVRWRPPYRFTMVEVSTQPDRKCTERDDGADDERTLFPGR